MTAQQLFKVLERAIQDGYGSAEVLFDTEARKFEYHMAKVGTAFLETEIFPERPLVILQEERA